MKDRLKKFIVKKLLKILEWFTSDETSSEKSFEEEYEANSGKTDEMGQTNNQKFFGKDSLFDKIKEIELEIFPFKKYSVKYYETYKEKLYEIKKDIIKYYEEQENKEEIYLRFMSGADYLIEIEKNIYNLLNEIKRYKKEVFNYEMGMYILNSTKDYLSKVYLKLLGTPNITILEEAYKTLNCELNEIYKLEIEECTAKQEEMCKMMCECIYIFFKCNCICNNYCDITTLKNIFEKEKNVFWNILLENVVDLCTKIEIFKDTKYYLKYQPYLNSIMDKSNIYYDVLLNEKFLKRFVDTEKSITVLHDYYMTHAETDNDNEENETLEECNVNNFEFESNGSVERDNNTLENEVCEESSTKEDVFINKMSDINDISVEQSQNMIKIDDLKNYLANLCTLYENDNYNLGKIYFWQCLIYNFKYDITAYEVYKLVYFFGMKTFFTNHLKTVEKNDLMKEIFNIHKDAKILVPRKNKNENDKYIKVLEFDPKMIDLDVTRKILSKLSIHLDERKITENLTEFYCLAEFFSDCTQIMKNLNEI